MTIIQLEYLLSVAKHGSFSVAANHCYVTQPSLSTQIKNLEDELGVLLLNRSTKPLELTEAGKIVVEKAKNAIAEFYMVEETVKEMKGEVSGTLKIAAIPTIAPYLLHKFIPKFADAYPKLHIEISEMFTHDIVKAINDGKIDVAILAAGFLEGSGIKEDILFEDRFYYYAADNNPLLNDSEVSVMDIDVSSLLLLADGHCLRTQILDLCNSKNPLGANLNLQGGSLETIIRMVDQAQKATILPKMAVDFMSEETRKTKVREFKERKSTSRQISIAYGKNFIKKATLESLKEFIIANHK
ncbi:MAG: LysR substrate-binding domain-containing protein [Rikenellaceae bacterium]